jgi:YYY domain-containing protein
MVQLFQMWALVEVLGLLCLPLTITVFHNLPDRGWAFSKAIGIALLAFCVWLPLMSVQVLPFSQLFIAVVFFILCAFSIFGFVRVRQALIALVRAHIFYIIVCELIFLGMVFLLGWIRSYGPNIQNFEMFMDEGFLAAIMRSPHFPPNDMWLSGYSINYYYYAHFTIAMLAKLLDQSPSIAFNTGICIFFGLTAVNLFGVTSNIVSWARYQRRRTVTVSGTSERRLWPAFLRRRQTADKPQHHDRYSDQPDTVLPSLSSAIPFGLLTILMGEVLGNLASTQQWWKAHDDLPPEYWFNTTRIIDKTINEFPAFSFLLSCFHAHVLALAFTIVAIALAFNLFLEYGGDGKGRGLRVFGSGWRLPLNLGVTALILGGLFTMNGWDFPTYLTLTIICIGLQQWMAYQSRFRIDLVLDVFTVVAALTALSFFLYAPFYLSFVSPSQGIGIVSATDRSAIRDEVLIYGLFVFIYVSLLVVNLVRPRLFAKIFSSEQSLALDLSKSGQMNLSQVGQENMQVSYSSGLLTTASGSHRTAPIQQLEEGTVSRNVVSVPLMGTLSSADQPLEEDTASLNVVAAPLADTENQFPDRLPPTCRRFTLPDWLDLRVISVVVILGVTLLAFTIMKNGLTFAVAFTIAALGTALALYHLHDRPRAFTLLLGAFAFGLVAMTEIVFLKDVFAGSYPRMNTVFKFYFQAWALLSITCGAALYFVYEGFQSAVSVKGWQRWVGRGGQVIWSAALLVFFLAGMVYPIVGSYQRTNHYTQRTNSLDGLNYLQSYDPSDYAAIRWLNSHVQGGPVIVEAFNPQGGDYSDYGRISAFTGLPTLMGWAGHEYQWRVNWLNDAYNANDFYHRGADISAIYTNTNPDTVLSLMNRYNAHYLYVGSLEKTTYPQANLNRFSGFMQRVYSANGVTIYRVPGGR